jgi:hypothetical protein
MSALFEAHWDDGGTTSPIIGSDSASGAFPSTQQQPVPPSISLVKEARFTRGSLLSGQGTIHFDAAYSEYLVGTFPANDAVFVDMLVWFDDFDVPSSGTTDQRILAIRGNGTTYANIVVVINTAGEAFFSLRNGNTSPLVVETDPDYQLTRNTLYRIGLSQNKTTGSITACWVKGNSAFISDTTYTFNGQTIGAQASQILFGATNPASFTGKLDAVRVHSGTSAPTRHTRTIPTSPGADLQSLFGDLWPGDILKLAPGNYDGWEITDGVVCQAIPGNPITIEGDENFGTWITGTKAHNRIKNPHSWIWRYINVDGSEYLGKTYDNLVIVRGNDWTWERSEIRYSTNNFKALFSVDGDSVIDALRPELLGQEGTINAISHGWTIADCWIHGNEGVNWNFKVIEDDSSTSQDEEDKHASYQDHCIYLTDSSNGTIERCILSDSPNGRAVKVG